MRQHARVSCVFLEHTCIFAPIILPQSTGALPEAGSFPLWFMEGSSTREAGWHAGARHYYRLVYHQGRAAPTGSERSDATGACMTTRCMQLCIIMPWCERGLDFMERVVVV